MFVVLLKYLKPIEVVNEWVVSHREFLDTGYQSGLLLCSGPQNPRTGGVILSRAATREKLQDFFKNDPFQKEGVAEYQIIEFEPVKFAEDFSKCIPVK